MHDDSELGSASALVAGQVSSRESSLTHVGPPGTYLQWPMSAFYSDFLRKRAAVARRDVVSEEVGRELLLTAPDSSGLGREFAWISSEIRDFVKNKDDSRANGDPWNRITEMAGFAIGGFVFQKSPGGGHI